MYTLNADQVAAYNRDGYVIVPAFFNNSEVDKLYRVATGDAAINNNS